MILPYTHKICKSEKFVSTLDDVCVEILNKKYSNWYCADCGYNTILSNHDYYMVHDKNWNSVFPAEAGKLCVTCLEKRLGRKLVFEDFTDCPLNRIHNSLYRKLLVLKHSRLTKFGMTADLIFGKNING